MMQQQGLISRDQAAKTLDWLAKLTSGSSSLQQAMLVAFARCCLFTNRHLMLPEHGAAEEADELSSAILDRGDENLNLDPLILAAHYLMLMQSGIRSDPLRAVLERIVAALAAQPDDVRQLGRVRYTILLLREAGFSVEGPASRRVPARLPATDRELLSMPIERIVDLLEHAAADGLVIAGDTAEILSLVTLAELRNYRIDLAAKMLRMMMAVGCRNPILDEAVAFIALQRSTDGRYGFFDPFAAEAATEAERAVSFNLPVTLNAVWLLHMCATNMQAAPSVCEAIVA